MTQNKMTMLCAAAMLTACGPLDESALDPDNGDPAISVVKQGLYGDQWTSFTSEEWPPLTLNNGRLVTAMRCSGGYCDNIALESRNIARSATTHVWTSWFSEEGSARRICPGNAFVTGVACRGSYCDNLSLQCTNFARLNKGSCYWTSFFSEEAAFSHLAYGYYATGVRCSGSYCDNKSIYACRALPY